MYLKLSILASSSEMKGNVFPHGINNQYQ